MEKLDERIEIQSEISQSICKQLLAELAFERIYHLDGESKETVIELEQKWKDSLWNGKEDTEAKKLIGEICDKHRSETRLRYRLQGTPEETFKAYLESFKNS
jgi:hypothetical protein